MLSREDHADIAKTVVEIMTTVLDARSQHQCFLTPAEQQQTQGIAQKTSIFEKSFIKTLAGSFAIFIVAAIAYYIGFKGQGG